MRKMKASWMSKPVNVHAWAVAQNGWEYYFLDDKKGDIRFAYVCGFENEMGDVSMSEIAPYLVSMTQCHNDLFDIAPAPDCEWMD